MIVLLFNLFTSALLFAEPVGTHHVVLIEPNPDEVQITWLRTLNRLAELDTRARWRHQLTLVDDQAGPVLAEFGRVLADVPRGEPTQLDLVIDAHRAPEEFAARLAKEVTDLLAQAQTRGVGAELAVRLIVNARFTERVKSELALRYDARLPFRLTLFTGSSNQGFGSRTPLVSALRVTESLLSAARAAGVRFSTDEVSGEDVRQVYTHLGRSQWEHATDDGPGLPAAHAAPFTHDASAEPSAEFVRATAALHLASLRVNPRGNAALADALEPPEVAPLLKRLAEDAVRWPDADLRLAASSIDLEFTSREEIDDEWFESLMVLANDERAFLRARAARIARTFRDLVDPVLIVALHGAELMRPNRDQITLDLWAQTAVDVAPDHPLVRRSCAHLFTED